MEPGLVAFGAEDNKCAAGEIDGCRAALGGINGRKNKRSWRAEGDQEDVVRLAGVLAGVSVFGASVMAIGKEIM